MAATYEFSCALSEKSMGRPTVCHFENADQIQLFFMLGLYAMKQHQSECGGHNQYKTEAIDEDVGEIDLVSFRNDSRPMSKANETTPTLPSINRICHSFIVLIMLPRAFFFCARQGVLELTFNARRAKLHFWNDLPVTRPYASKI